MKNMKIVDNILYKITDDILIDFRKRIKIKNSVITIFTQPIDWLNDDK
jgi:hypothetical protein